ncbi:MAG: SAP domain-containing protein, partial [Candidatus Kariarchaeaceae archaeon]
PAIKTKPAKEVVEEKKTPQLSKKKLEGMAFNDLKKHLKILNLTTAGKKVDLIKRIQDHQAAQKKSKKEAEKPKAEAKPKAKPVKEKKTKSKGKPRWTEKELQSKTVKDLQKLATSEGIKPKKTKKELIIQLMGISKTKIQPLIAEVAEEKPIILVDTKKRKVKEAPKSSKKFTKIELEKMPFNDLKKLLKSLNLSTTGKKVDLIKRIQKHQSTKKSTTEKTKKKAKVEPEPKPVSKPKKEEVKEVVVSTPPRWSEEELWSRTIKDLRALAVADGLQPEKTKQKLIKQLLTKPTQLKEKEDQETKIEKIYSDREIKNMNIKELRDILAEKGLSPRGTKAYLSKRLAEYQDNLAKKGKK